MDQNQITQASNLLQMVTTKTPIDSSLLDDYAVVEYFMDVSDTVSEARYDFFCGCSLVDQVRLTHLDLIQEEMVVDVHIEHGFSLPVISQWLRGLDFGSYQFFIDYCRQKQVVNVDHMIDQTRSFYRQVDGVVIEDRIVAHQNLKTIVIYAINNRINFKQYQDMLQQTQPNLADVRTVCDHLMEAFGVLKPIKTPDQVLRFRVFCALIDFSDMKDMLMDRIFQIINELLQRSSLEKCMQLLNTMPYDVILYSLKQFIDQNVGSVCGYLNEHLSKYEHGHLRKIVRRNHLGLNY